MFKKKVDKMNQYQSPMAELSNRQLRFSGWYVRHKDQLGQAGMIALFLFGLSTMGYALYGWTTYLLVGYGQDQKIFHNLVSQFSNYDNIKPLYEVQPLEFSATRILSSGEGLYDFVTEIRNPNIRNVAVISFSYDFAGKASEPQDVVVLPGQTTLLVAFGQESDSYPGGAQLNISNIVWHRIDPHAVFDVGQYISERLSFTTTDVVFTAANARDGVPSHRLTFDITNDSAYSYWQARFVVKLFEGGQLVGVLPLTMDRFQAGKTRSVELRSLVPELSVSEIALVPMIDVFDEREFILPR